MPVATPVRRTVHYASLDEVLADAERLVRAKAPTTGNWSLDQILGHLAIAMEKSIEGFDRQAPWLIGMVGRLIFKPRILKHGMKPGFKLPADAEKTSVPVSGGDPHAALDQLRQAIARLKTDPTRKPHPFFGPMPSLRVGPPAPPPCRAASEFCQRTPRAAHPLMPDRPIRSRNQRIQPHVEFMRKPSIGFSSKLSPWFDFFTAADQAITPWPGRAMPA